MKNKWKGDKPRQWQWIQLIFRLFTQLILQNAGDYIEVGIGGNNKIKKKKKKKKGGEAGKKVKQKRKKKEKNLSFERV